MQHFSSSKDTTLLAESCDLFQIERNYEQHEIRLETVLSMPEWEKWEV